jgi:hypothetical protein
VAVFAWDNKRRQPAVSWIESTTSLLLKAITGFYDKSCRTTFECRA